MLNIENEDDWYDKGDPVLLLRHYLFDDEPSWNKLARFVGEFDQVNYILNRYYGLGMKICLDKKTVVLNKSVSEPVGFLDKLQKTIEECNFQKIKITLS